MNATPRKPTKKPVNVLVLCHGNTHRSPLAAAVLVRHLGEGHVRSRALKGYDRNLRVLPPAAKKVREYAEREGLDLGGHRAKVVMPEDLRWADLILYMDGANLERAGEVFDTADHAKSRCLASYAGESRIPDPAFTPRGPELDRLLGLVVRAADACGAALCAGSGAAFTAGKMKGPAG